MPVGTLERDLGLRHVAEGHQQRRAVRTMPTMPPAGTESIASLPWNARASVRPPLDWMKKIVTPAISHATCST